MKDIYSKIIILLLDLCAISLSIIIEYTLRILFDDSFYIEFDHDLNLYLNFWALYLFPITLMAYEGIYTKRYDFWHESREIIKSLFMAFIVILAILAMTKTIDDYSRATILFIFIAMAFFIPLFKNIGKKTLYKIGLWKLEANIIGDDPFIADEIFKNHYFGYIKSTKEKAKTVFINSHNLSVKELRIIVDKEIKKRKEVIFIPLFNDYNITQSHIYELSNTHTNLIVFKNRLKSQYRVVMQQIFNYALSILLLPILLPIIAIFAILIKRESPGPVFFTHDRIGKNGKIIPILKFRSMYNDASERLIKLFHEDESVKEEWEKNFKLKNDPRVTKIGAFLRKTSLDELPQVFNVLKGEMNLVGPRPVIQQEIDQYYKENAEYYFMVNPGMTGLWQVSGRSDTDYDFRVGIDKWYISNWSLWLDIVILIKTVKVVLQKNGAY